MGDDVENGRDVRPERPGLTVLFTTGYTPEAAFRQGKLDPGAPVITKPHAG